jgi:hypothetical protein
MAAAPDGSLVFGDWVDKSYPVHGKGKLWRLTLVEDDQAETMPLRRDDMTAAEQASDAFVKHRVVDSLLEHDESAAKKMTESPQAELRLAALQALRFWSLEKEVTAAEILKRALGDPDPNVRIYAVRWVADERIKSLRDEVAKLLDAEPPSRRYYLAVLAALEWLDGDDKMRSSSLSDGLLGRELRNAKRSAKMHALALQAISPDNPLLTAERLRGYLDSPEPALRTEAVRTLAMQSAPERFALLAEVAADERRDSALRAEALVGLAEAIGEHRELFEKFSADDIGSLGREAKRLLRLAGMAPASGEAKPPATDLAAWEKLLGEGGNSTAGRRLFFASVGPRCGACHVYDGKGGRIGPELTGIGSQQPRARLIASILQPSRDVAPQFQPWTLRAKNGKTYAGLRLPKPGDDGTELYSDASGNRFTLLSEEIENRQPCAQSIMPDGLERTLSIDDLRDLIAFLAAKD